MASQKDNLAALAKLGVTQAESKVEGILPLKGDESAKDVADILKAVKAKVAHVENTSNKDEPEADAAQGDTVLVWVKGRTYINDKERVDGGFYRVALPLPERLAKSPTTVVEVFADDIPPRKLTEIAKWLGIAHPEDYKDEDILAKMVSGPLKPF